MKLLRSFVIICLPLALAAQNNNPILVANALVAKMDSQYKAKAYKETLNLRWTPEEINTKVTEYGLINTNMRYLAMPDGVGMKVIQFNGYESTLEMTFYCFGEIPFYAILKSSAEGCDYQYKVYYENSSPIKCLRQTNKCTGGILGSVEEIKDDYAIREELDSFEQLKTDSEEQVEKYLMGLEEKAEIYPLRKEIKEISNYAELIDFISVHSPSFNDLDTLYTLISGKPCPKDLTKGIVNGDPNMMQSVPKDYLHFVFRNCHQQFEYNIQSQKNIEIVNYFSDFQTNMMGYQDKVDMEIASNYPVNYPSFSMLQVTFVPSSEQITVGSNFKSWFSMYVRSRLNYYPTIFSYKSKIVMYKVHHAQDFEIYSEEFERAQEQEKIQFESKFTTNTYSKNLFRFIQSQVFNDVVFLYINNRWVFFDIER